MLTGKLGIPYSLIESQFPMELLQSRSCDSVANLGSPRRATRDSIASSHQPLPFERRSLLDELAAKGVRLTVQRRAVIETIQDADRHLDASLLLDLARAKEPNINRATVYRTIDLLKRLRLIDELDLMHLEGEKHYYEVKTTRDHIHLACFRCGRIEEFSSSLFERLKAEISSKAGFTIRTTRLEIGGTCQVCADAGAVPNQPEEAITPTELSH
jgi:Fur family ferric uptake transcriptional regulator